jgi:D-tyrosyl-tRNA(Tyr) deacylase
VRALIQRVKEAWVEVEGERIAEIGLGLLVYVGFGHQDRSPALQEFARKLPRFRLFPPEGHERSLLDVGGSVLLVSQFTLYGELRRGRRPSFTAAAPYAEGAQRFQELTEYLRAEGVSLATGRFGALMEVGSRNWGPFTLWWEDEDA